MQILKVRELNRFFLILNFFLLPAGAFGPMVSFLTQNLVFMVFNISVNNLYGELLLGFVVDLSPKKQGFFFFECEIIEIRPGPHIHACCFERAMCRVAYIGSFQDLLQSCTLYLKWKFPQSICEQYLTILKVNYVDNT